MTFNVSLTREALEDLLRLEDFLVESALAHGDFDLPRRAVAAIRREFRILETNPFTCRIAETDRLERELVIPFGLPGMWPCFEYSRSARSWWPPSGTSGRMTTTRIGGEGRGRLAARP